MKKLAVVLVIVLTLVVAGAIAITFAVRHFFIAAIRELGATSVLNAVYWTKDGEDSFSYVVTLRPWGATWDDVDEAYRPYYYESGYLPRVEAGGSAPDDLTDIMMGSVG